METKKVKVETPKKEEVDHEKAAKGLAGCIVAIVGMVISAFIIWGIYILVTV